MRTGSSSSECRLLRMCAGRRGFRPALAARALRIGRDEAANDSGSMHCESGRASISELVGVGVIGGASVGTGTRPAYIPRTLYVLPLARAPDSSSIVHSRGRARWFGCVTIINKQRLACRKLCCEATVRLRSGCLAERSPSDIAQTRGGGRLFLTSKPSFHLIHTSPSRSRHHSQFIHSPACALASNRPVGSQ